MIADGHFKEMRDILAHIYTQRLQIKTNKKIDKSNVKGLSENAEVIELGEMQDVLQDKANFYMSKNLEESKGDGVVAWDNVQDLCDEDGVFEEIKQEGNIIFDQDANEEDGQTKQKKQKTKS